MLAYGKPLNLPCGTKMPGPMASSILTTYALALVEIWQHKARYGSLVIMKPPTSVVDKALHYNLEEIDLQAENEMEEEDCLQEANGESSINYD